MKRSGCIFLVGVYTPILIGSLAMVSSCGARVEETPKGVGEAIEGRAAPPTPVEDTMQGAYDLLVDTETGCQYWRNRQSYGNTVPRWTFGGSGASVKGCVPER